MMGSCGVRRWLVGLVLAAVSTGAAGPGSAPPRALKPARGRFLVATRSLEDPQFAETVALLLDVTEEGATAVVINRPTDIRLSKLLPNITALRERVDVAFLGGPVMPTHLMVLVRGKPVGDSAEHVFGDVHVLTGKQAIRETLAAGLPRRRLRAYVGHAGWMSGQLDEEIQDGDWLVAAGDAELIFAEHAEDAWRHLIERSEGEWTRYRSPTRVATVP